LFHQGTSFFAFFSLHLRSFWNKNGTKNSNARTFNTKGETKTWVMNTEGEIRMGRYQDVRPAEKLPFHEVLAKYLERISAAKGVANDFNTMLGDIFGHTELVLEDLDPATKLYVNLQAIRYAAEHSVDLTG
jgi:hypothetical protein